jgi:hypothetical protein
VVAQLLFLEVHLLQKGDLLAPHHQDGRLGLEQELLDLVLHFAKRVGREQNDAGIDKKIAGTVVGSDLLNDLLHLAIPVVHVSHRMLLAG